MYQDINARTSGKVFNTRYLSCFSNTTQVYKQASKEGLVVGKFLKNQLLLIELWYLVHWRLCFLWWFLFLFCFVFLVAWSDFSYNCMGQEIDLLSLFSCILIPTETIFFLTRSFSHQWSIQSACSPIGSDYPLILKSDDSQLNDMLENSNH